MRRTTKGVAAAAAITLLLAGCGSSGQADGPTTTAAPAGSRATTAPAEETTTTGAEEPSTTTEESTTGASAVDLPDDAPVGEVVIEDQFADDSNGWIGDADYSDSEVSGSIEDGFLSIGGQSNGQTLDLWPDAIAGDADQYTDQRVTATFTLTEEAAANVTCRVDPEGHLAREYVFTINPKRGTFHIRKYDGKDQNPQGLEIAPHEVFEALKEGKSLDDIDYEPAFTWDAEHQYTVTGQCVDVDDGVELTMFVDGEQVVHTVDTEDPIRSGLGGLSAEGSAAGVSWGATADSWVFEQLDGDG